MEKINNKEAISLTISCSLGITVFISSQIIASECLSSSLINTGFISLIAMGLTAIICILYKKFIGISILDITEFVETSLSDTCTSVWSNYYFNPNNLNSENDILV